MNISINIYDTTIEAAWEMALELWKQHKAFSTDVNVDGDLVVSKNAHQREPYNPEITDHVVEVVKSLVNMTTEGKYQLLALMSGSVSRDYKFFSTMLDFITEVITMENMQDIVYTERVIFMTNDLIWDLDVKTADEFHSFFIFLQMLQIYVIHHDEEMDFTKKAEALDVLNLEAYEVLR